MCKHRDGRLQADSKCLGQTAAHSSEVSALGREEAHIGTGNIQALRILPAWAQYSAYEESVYQESQEEADIWARFMAMGLAKGLEWAKKMVVAQGVQQQSETSTVTNIDEVQPSDSGLCLQSEESTQRKPKIRDRQGLWLEAN
ncbi:hypothetical protein NDU88_001634 [Pleurodeles waltl]|uniref:Uncharacterized protein n=1 Tax=Pleurodeles waltl TaxID=8319 RepID=A0AAV7VWZ3_PLEWA|nr:hypothetical protein NDU88_001634 [Pleurodeles waltl]